MDERGGPNEGAAMEPQSVDGLQRALEVELVDCLKTQNSKLSQEVGANWNQDVRI